MNFICQRRCIRLAKTDTIAHYYSCITCGKSVCVRVECSIAEENEDTLGCEANKSVSYCLPCTAAAPSAGQNGFFNKSRHPCIDIEPAALENESLDEGLADNIEPACFVFPAPGTLV